MSSNHFKFKKAALLAILLVSSTGCRVRIEYWNQCTRRNGSSSRTHARLEYDTDPPPPPSPTPPADSFPKVAKLMDESGQVVLASLAINPSSVEIIPKSGTVAKFFSLDFLDIDTDDFYTLSIDGGSPTQLTYGSEIDFSAITNIFQVSSVTIGSLDFLSRIDFSLFEEELNNPDNLSPLAPISLPVSSPSCQIPEKSPVFALISLGILGLVLVLRRRLSFVVNRQ